MQDDESRQGAMDQEQKSKAACRLRSAAGELRGDLRAAADDMRSFAGEFGSDLRNLIPGLKSLSSGFLEKVRASRRKGFASGMAEGAAALKANADAHGDDIRRAAGLTGKDAAE